LIELTDMREAQRSYEANINVVSATLRMIQRTIDIHHMATPALALKIREVAGNHSVPIVENPSLVRALHATVEVDQQIPPEHYKTVAEVIGYVMRLRRMVSGRL